MNLSVQYNKFQFKNNKYIIILQYVPKVLGHTVK